MGLFVSIFKACLNMALSFKSFLAFKKKLYFYRSNKKDILNIKTIWKTVPYLKKY